MFFRVGFFCADSFSDYRRKMGINDRDSVKQLAEFAGVQQQLRSGLPPKQVGIAFVGDALVVCQG